jgi:hypothetical protein
MYSGKIAVPPGGGGIVELPTYIRIGTIPDTESWHTT